MENLPRLAVLGESWEKGGGWGNCWGEDHWAGGGPQRWGLALTVLESAMGEPNKNAKLGKVEGDEAPRVGMVKGKGKRGQGTPQGQKIEGGVR